MDGASGIGRRSCGGFLASSAFEQIVQLSPKRRLLESHAAKQRRLCHQLSASSAGTSHFFRHAYGSDNPNICCASARIDQLLAAKKKISRQRAREQKKTLG